MNLSPNVRPGSSVSVYFATPTPTSPSAALIATAQPFLQLQIPQVMLELGKRIEADEDVVSLPGTKQISEIKTINEANAAFQSVLAKIKRLIETGQTPALSGDIKDLDAEISQLEERLFQAAKQGALTSYALKKELEVAKDFHKVLGSLNDYLDFQQNYSPLDRQLDHSLGQINDALFSDLHGLSTPAFSGIASSLKNLAEQILLTAPILEGKNPFAPEVLSLLNLGVNSTASACSDWFSDLLSHSVPVITSTLRTWQALDQKEGSDLEKYAAAKETGHFLLSMKHSMNELKQSLPELKKQVEICRSQLARKEMQKNLDLLLQDMEKLEKALPGILETMESQIHEKEIEKSMEQYASRAGKTLEAESVRTRIKDYTQLEQSDEGKLDSYVRLKRTLNAVLSLPRADKNLLKEVEAFCAKEEKRLNGKAEEALDFETLMSAQLIKEAQPKPNWFLKTLSALDPANWSEGTKQAAHVFLTAAQLSQQGIEVYQKIGAQRAVLLKGPPLSLTQQQQIDEGASKIELFLTDRFRSLKDPHFFATATKKNPEVRAYLKTVLDSYPAQPSEQQIKAIVKGYGAYQKQCFQYPKQALDPAEWISGEKGAAASTQTGPFKQIAPPETAEKTEGIASSMIRGIGSFVSSFWANRTDSSKTTEARIIAGQEKPVEQLKEAVKTLEQAQTGMREGKPSALQQLKQETALLLENLRETMLDRPETCSPLPEWMEWNQKVAKQCFEVKTLEKEINKKMQAYLLEVPIGDDTLDVFGNKHKNLVKQAILVEAMELPGVHVPLPRGVSTGQVTQFLKAVAPQIFEKWEQLSQLHAEYKGENPFLENEEAAQMLSSIQKDIEKAFEKVAGEESVFDHLGLSEEIKTWVSDIEKQGNYLMVRSTGAEDSKKSANAGGNFSAAYVKPTFAAFAEAMGQVVSSYFGASSLQKRFDAELNPFREELRLAVTAQELIGEPVGGAKVMRDIPVSLVLFSNEPLYIGDEKFRAMRLSATYGHGEGVVGNHGIGTDTVLVLQSTVHPDKIYILYDNQEKPERLAPVRLNGRVVLKKIPNHPDMVKRPALGKEEIIRLFQWGVVGEKFFQDDPTDMEIVWLNGKIYPVQARPVNRPELLPTYIDFKKIEALKKSPVMQSIETEMIVPGRASVVEIVKPDETLISDTLEKAEGLFRKGLHKLVVVEQQEPANSHPVVNFSGLGMPCLFANDLNAVREMTKSASEKQPIAACIQSATLHQWDATQGAISDYTTKGFVVHPAKISISLSITKPVPQYAGVNFEVSQEIKGLLRKIGMATRKNDAKKVVQELQSHPWIRDFRDKIAALEKKSQELFLEKPLRPIIEAARELEARLDKAFEQVDAVLKNPQKEQKLELLIHVKVLENLLKSAPVAGVSKFSVANFEAAFQAADVLTAYQKQLPHQAIFADVLMDGTQSPIESAFDAWNDFLLKLEPVAKKTLDGEPTGLTPADLTLFKDTLAKLREGDVLPLFMTFFFEETKDPVETVKKINQMMPQSDMPMVDSMAAQKKEINSFRNDIGQFGEPKGFPVVWERLKALAENFNPKKVPWLQKKQWDSASPIARSFAIKAMNDLVDVFDLSIKSMKASQQFKDPVEKLQKFKEMLGPYFSLLKGLAEATVGPKGYVTHSGSPLPTYLNRIESILQNLSDRDLQNMESSRRFSVSAATLGSGALFDRHLPQTLEDVFTLIHQNLLASTSALTRGMLSSEQIVNRKLPENLKRSLLEAGSIQGNRSIGRPQQIGIEVDQNGITIHYNVPLRNHSSKFSIHFDRQTQKMTMKALFLGEARERWQQGMERILLLDGCGLLPLESPKMTPQELSFTWEVTTKEQLRDAYEEFGEFAEQTLGAVRSDAFIERLKNRFSVEELLQRMVKIPPSGLQADLLEELLDLEGHEKEIFSVAKEGLKNRDQRIRSRYFSLVDQLIKDGLHEEVILAAREGMKGDSQSLATSIALWTALYRKKHDINEVTASAQEGMKSGDETVVLVSLRLLNLLVEYGDSFEEALSGAQAGMKNPNPDIRAVSMGILRKLVESNYRIEEAFTLFKQEIKKYNAQESDEFVDFVSKIVSKDNQYANLALFLVKDNLCLGSLSILLFLIPKGYAAEEGFIAAQEGIKSQHEFIRIKSVEILGQLVEKGERLNEALLASEIGRKDSDVYVRERAIKHILIPLVEKDIGLQEAIVAVKEDIHHPGMTSPILNLAERLVSKGQGVNEFLEIFKMGAKNENSKDRITSIELLKLLVDKGFGIKEAIEIVKEEIHDPDVNVRLKIVKLVRQLLDQGQGFDVLLEISKIGIKDEYWGIRKSFIKLLRLFVEKDTGFQEAIAAAKEGIHDPQTAVRQSILALSKNLFDKGQRFDVLLEIAKTGIKDKYWKIRELSILLLSLLVRRGVGVHEASEVVKEGMKDPENVVREASLSLSQQLQRLKKMLKGGGGVSW